MFGSLYLAEEVNDCNFRLRLTEKINVGSLSLATEVNDRNIRLCLKVKNKCRDSGVCI